MFSGKLHFRKMLLLVALGCSGIPSLVVVVHAEDPMLVSALGGYSPRQSDVVYEKVSTAEIAQCSGKEEKRTGANGYAVKNGSGLPLRWFADTNGDRKVDQWCYFLNGVEVYRDIDSDFNGVADEYRWLGTGGMRWGIDSNEDGKIDRWKMISAEEVTSEVVEAIRTGDADRFRRLLLNSEELNGLGLGQERFEQLKARVSSAAAEFPSFVKSQKFIGKDARWVSFGATRPGLIPKGTEGSSSDLIAYENAVAVFEDGSGKPQQLLIGTLIQVDSNWRLADLPKAGSDSVVQEGGLMFSSSARNATADPSSLPSKIQELYTNLEKIDEKIAKANADQKAVLHDERADLLEKLISASDSEEDRMNWTQQFADTVMAAAQTGEYPKGVERLRRFEEAMSTIPKLRPLQSYVAFRTITAEYVVNVNAPKANFSDVQDEYLNKLEKFVSAFPKSNDSAEALVQIGLSKELAGEPEKAIKWYSQAAKDYADTLNGRKADGAARRLSLEGKKLPLAGKTLDGRNFEMSAYAKQVVVLHCWASWCDPCKADMNKLRALQAKFARTRGLAVVGINVDETKEKALQFLKQENYPWVHLYDDGGMESDLAVKLGAISLPITIVLNGSGVVVSSATHFSPDLEQKIEELLAPPKSTKK